MFVLVHPLLWPLKRMKPVDQSIFEDGKGNCLAACVASLLELPIEEVPNFAELNYFAGLHKWLAERGLIGIEITFSEGVHFAKAYFGYANGPLIMWGESPRSNGDRRKGHAVVGTPAGYGCDLLHDPHPSRAGLNGHPHGVMWIARSVFLSGPQH